MKKTNPRRSRAADAMRREYHFDYRLARPNRFARKMSVVVILDEDVAKVFTTPQSVNKALRALIAAVPSKSRRKTVIRQ